MKKTSQIFALSLLALFVTPTMATPSSSTEAQSVPQAAAPVVATTEGAVSGVLLNNDKTQGYLGIPYAATPTGVNRWKAPQKAVPHKDVFQAVTVAPKSLQVQKGKIQGTEDCLKLNIWRPNNTDKDLPVMVFLHGGNNQTGSSTAASNGEKLAANINAVVVGLNYRLGPLGFIELSALKSGNALEDSGNFTLLDINAALDWVIANIKQFGGDPKNITIAGHSAGGRDVMAILTSPLFKGKFQKAMSFSGGQTISDPAWARKIHTKAFAKLAVSEGKAKDEAEAEKWLNSGSPDVKTWLYSLPGEKIVKQMSGAKIRMRVFPHLFADGTVLPDIGMKVYDYPQTAKKVSDVPMLLIADATEFKFYCATDPFFKKSVEDKSVLTDPVKHAQYQYASDYGSRFFGHANTQNSIERISQHLSSPLYAAIFRWGSNPEVVGEEMAFIHGAKHGIHMDFIFEGKAFDLQKKYPETYKNDGVKSLSNMVQSYIGNFLHTGNPNGNNLVKWTPWDKKENSTYLFLDADKNKAHAEMTSYSLDVPKTLQAMRQDKSISEEAKNTLLHKVLDGRFFSYKIDKEFNNPDHIMP